MIVFIVVVCTFYGYNLWFYKSAAWGTILWNLTVVIQLFAVFMLINGINRIKKLLVDDPQRLFDFRASMIHVVCFGLYGAAELANGIIVT
jgi:hypothetical protein